MDLELILIVLLPLLVLYVMILDRKAISTHHALDKAFGRPQIVYREDGVGYDMVYRNFTLVDYDLYLIDERLTELVEREGKYEMDFSTSLDKCDAQTYDIPFVFKKKY